MLNSRQLQTFGDPDLVGDFIYFQFAIFKLHISQHGLFLGFGG